MIKIALMGFGTVGVGIYKIIENKKDDLINILNEDLEIKKILVRDITKIRKITVDKSLLTSNPNEILDDPEIDIIVEVIGGMNPTYEYICRALANGKHVVTANKEVVSEHLQELLELAKENNKKFLFEASVGGGIPIIKELKQIAAINDITEIKGILNGTSNFILSQMMSKNISFKESLSLAQELGYAEANPVNDIEGNDAARKLSILSSIAFKTNIDKKHVEYRGISSIDKVDIFNFKNMNKSVKLMATAMLENTEICACVEPVLLSEKSQFYKVEDNNNMVSVIGDNIQNLQFFGRGAGEKPTANAIVGDIIDIIKQTCHECRIVYKKSKHKVISQKQISNYYFRVTSSNEKQNEVITDLLDKKNLRYEIIEHTQDWVLIIKSIDVDDMKSVASQLKINNIDFCYVRICE